MAKFYTAGDNSVNKVYGENISVEQGYYYNPCADDEMQYYWEARKGEIYANGGPELIELDTWQPKQPFQNEFAWASCGFQPPETDCADFPEQEIGSKNPKINVNNGQKMEDLVLGACIA